MENNKLTNYIEKFTTPEEIIDSPKSRYYKFNGNILRVSDHIGSSSSGAMSIIKTNIPDQYAVHRHSDGNLVIYTYEEVKCMIKSFDLFSKVFIDKTGIHNFEIQKNAQQAIADMEKMKMNGDYGNTILGLHKSHFSHSQLKQIEAFVKQVKKK